MKTWCQWRQISTSSKQPPTAQTNFTQLDIFKTKEAFQSYVTVEFCSHLTLGIRQSSKESLHNFIWNFCPKVKYISPRSIAISTAVAVTIFNEGELSIYGFMKDLQLHPTLHAFGFLCKWEDTKMKNRDYFRKKNMDRRTRPHKSSNERREKDE